MDTDALCLAEPVNNRKGHATGPGVWPFGFCARGYKGTRRRSPTRAHVLTIGCSLVYSGFEKSMQRRLTLQKQGFHEKIARE
jgi:hypothetical protein